MVDKYYLDPNFDRSAVEPSITPDKYLGLVQPSIQIGERQVPGQDGWRLADTPQAWVYVQKKQWIDETWTYVVADTALSEKARELEDKIAEKGRLQTELDELVRGETKAIASYQGTGSPAQMAQEAQVQSEYTRKQLENEIKQANTKIAKLETEVNSLKSGGSGDRTAGKLQQIDIRSALGRIIARKIDWMSDHEKFTKVSGAVQNSVLGLGQQRAYRQRIQNLLLDAANATVETNVQIDTLTNSINANNARIQSLYDYIRDLRQAISDNGASIVAKQNDYESIVTNPSVLPGPDDASRAQQLQQEISDLLKKNTEYEAAITSTQEEIDKVNALMRQSMFAMEEARDNRDQIIEDSLASRLVSDAELDLDPLVIEDSSPVTFSGNAFTRYYKAPITRTKDTKQVLQYKQELETERNRLEAVLQQVVNEVRRRSNPSEETTAADVTTEEIDQLATIHKSYVEIRRKIYQLENALREGLDTAPVILESGDPIFNGVMELANVSSVNTTVTLEGEGSATITIENPQNVFYISEEDIILSLVDMVNVCEGAVVPMGEDLQTDMVYYKGGYYPSYIVQMLSRAPSSGVDIRTISDIGGAARAAQNTFFSPAYLKQQIAYYEKQKEDIISQVSKGDLDRSIGMTRVMVTSKEIEELQKQLEVVEGRANDSSVAGGDAVDVNWDEINSGPVKELLTRYYQGKTIFEVLDRVFIWMTTPTRTPFRLPGATNRFAVEDPAVLSSAQQKVQADNELDDINVEIAKFADFYQRMLEFAQLQQSTAASSFNDTHIVPVSYQELSGFTVIYGDKTSDGEMYKRALETEKGRLEAISKYVGKELADADSFTASRIRDRLSDKSSMGAYSDTQYDARYLGLEEQKLQVFQGVVSSVKRTYSDGKYQITLNCRDNMVFLDMSRIMKKPALNITSEPVGVLDDPIWRYTERAGVWKSGVVVVPHNFVGDEVEQRIQKKVQLSELEIGTISDSEGRLQWSPLVLTEPFAQIDAANVISLLVLGLPYNPTAFIQAAMIGGRVPATNTKSGISDQQSKDISFFTSLKKQVGDLNDRLGDFQPFLDFESGVYRKNDLEKNKKLYQDELSSNLELLEGVYTNFVITRIKQYGKYYSTAFGPKALEDVANTDTCNTQGMESTKTEVLGGGKSKVFLDKLLEAVREVVKLKGGANTKTQASAEEKAKGDGSQVSNDKGQAAQTANGKLSEFKTVSVNSLEGFMPVPVDKVNELAKMLASMTDADGPFGRFSASILAKVGGNPQFNIELVPFGGMTEEADKTIQYTKALQGFVLYLFKYDMSYKTQFSAAVNATQRLNEYETLIKRFAEFVGGYESNAVGTSENTSKINTNPVPIPINLLASSPEKIIRKRKINYLVISDRYTLDLDIQAFITMVGFDPDLFQSETESPLSVCRRAAEEIDFEFYCDENGHIRFKPPTYNRLLKEHYSKLGNTDRVAKDALLIQYGADYGQLVKKLIQAQSKIEKALFNYEKKYDDIKNLKEEEEARKMIQDDNFPIDESLFIPINYESPSACLGKVKQNLAFDLKVAIEVESRLNDVGFYETTRVQDIVSSSSDKLEQLSRLLALYETIISAVGQLKSMTETSLRDARIKADNAVKKLDSFYDEFRIHKIPNYNMISSDFTEAPPRFTRLDLVGSPNFTEVLGPAYYWTGGVDYDMWRNYGYLFERIQKAYFHDGAACVPYARALLGRERGRIFSGSITVRGDSKYRVGDCVFIEDEGMYYYVITVSQNFSYGGSYTTNLTLAYGRRIGEIIPHPFDILGGIVLSTYQSDLEDLLTQEITNKREQNKIAEAAAKQAAAKETTAGNE